MPETETKLTGKRVLKGKDERDEAVRSSKSELMNKIKDSRLSQFQKQQCKNLLAEFVQFPEKLVGKEIQHKVKEEGCDEVYWSKAKIVEIIKLNSKNVKNSSFGVIYDDEPDATWTFPIISDFEKGDVIIL